MQQRAAKLKVGNTYYLLQESTNKLQPKKLSIYDLPKELFNKLVERACEDKFLKFKTIKKKNINLEIEKLKTRYGVDDIEVQEPMPGKKSKKSALKTKTNGLGKPKKEASKKSKTKGA
jgi:hypothetical protein